MVKIFRSDIYLGNLTFLENDPHILHLKDHIYLPSGISGCVPAVYDFGRKMVHQSFYSRGPVPSEIFPTCSMPFAYESIKEYAEDDTYIFLGEVHDHFGHFLLSTLSRLWQIGALPASYKIIINAGAAARVQRSHVKQLFEAFEVDIARLWSPEKPFKIRNLLLPCPSFEERNFVHATFGRTFNAVGDRITQGVDPGISGTGPIYLSKSKMTAGVRKITNESLIEEKLAAEGYTIIYPETLPIAEQAAIWRLGRLVVAFNGSSLHTSALSPEVRMVSLGWDRFVDSSFTLCDLAKRNRSDYFYFEPGTFRDQGPSPDHYHGIVGLSSRIEAVDPLGVAEGILRAVDASMVERKSNLAYHMPTSQSSTYVEADYDASTLSATSGELTGRYQFHTVYEEEPWWQVDLGEVCEIQEVVLYNRTDSAPERASQCRILLSQDGDSFDLVFRCEVDHPFGGLNGEPFHVRFDEVQRARFLRLSILGPDFFHLDQVEVFGRRPSVT